MEFKLVQIIAHLGIYLVVIIALKKLYIDPALSLIRKRELLTSGRVESSQELVRQLSEMRQEYSDVWERTKEELDARRVKVLKEVRSETEKKLAQAKKDNERKIAEHQRILAKELKDLDPKVPQLASEISKEILDSVMSAKVIRI